MPTILLSLYRMWTRTKVYPQTAFLVLASHNSALGTVKLVYPPIHRHYDLGLFHLKRAHNEEDAIIDEVMQEEKLRRKRRGEHLGSRWTFKEE